MDRNEALRLRDELSRGKRLLADLHGDEFQGLMYWLLVDRFITPMHQITLSDECKGEVEVMVVEHLDPPQSAVRLGRGERTHFFECKRYGSSYELSDLGRLFCAAIRHQPETVALISSRPLQLQAHDYADLLFGREGRFSRVDFQHLRAELLLGLPLDHHAPADADAEPNAADQFDTAQQSVQAAEWRLIEHGVFHDRIIASIETPTRLVRLSTDRRYTLDIRGALIEEEDPEAVRVALLSPAAPGAVLHATRPRARGHDFLARFTLTPEELASRSDGWTVQINASGSRRALSRLRLPEMEVTAAAESLLPDVRSDESSVIVEALRVGDEVITFISGEAGVGKSYLCRQIASTLKFGHGYQVENFRAESVADGSLFVRMLLRLLTPRFHDGGAQGTPEFESRVITEALRCLLRELTPAESESLSQAIAASDLSRAHPERIVPLLASLLVQSGDVLIVLQDCHELPPALIAALDALIVALDERDWAGTRLVLEYRDGSGADNLAWTSFVRRVQATLHSRTRATRLRNLTQERAEDVLRPLFDAVTDELLSAIWSQTGGNPLLLTSLLRSLVASGTLALAAGETGRRLQVRHPARILEGRPLVAEKPRLILENRIRLLNAKKPAGLGEAPSVVPILALLALTEDILETSAVFGYLGLTPSDGQRLIRWLTREEILAPAAGERAASVFAHDLIRDTVMELGREDGETLSAAERIVDEVIPEGFPALFRMAHLARYIGDRRLSREYLDRGQEAAKKENRFNWSRRFQLQLLETLRTTPNAGFRDRLAQLGLLNDLGWSEHNAGSNRVSREYYHEARAVAERLPLGEGNWTPQLKRSTLAHLDHRLMTIDLALLDFEACLPSAERALNHVGDPTVLGKIINRLVLCCSVLGFVEEGMYFANAGVELASASRDPEVNAVLCTDISTFLSPGLPRVALRLAEQGVDLAHSPRQRMHNEYARMKQRLWADGFIDPPTEREDFGRRLRGLGMAVLEGVLSNFEGVVQLIHGNAADARRLFSQAEVHARLYDQAKLEAVIWNNAMVAALLQGDLPAAEAHRVRLYGFWTRITEQRRRVAPLLGSLTTAFKGACSRVAPHREAATLRLSPAPPFAGELLPSLLNLSALHDAGWRAEPTIPEPSALLETWGLHSGRRPLSAAPAVILAWSGVPLYLDP